MNELDGNILPTEEECEACHNEFEQLMKWANSLTGKQIDFLCDGGWYNNAIRGYLIAAARIAGLTDEQISELVDCLRIAFDENNKSNAERISNKF